MRWRPYSPSWERALSCGRTGVNICMTMDEVMYGYTPIAATLMDARAPPLKRLRKPRRASCSNDCDRACTLTPGTGMWATNL